MAVGRAQNMEAVLLVVREASVATAVIKEVSNIIEIIVQRPHRLSVDGRQMTQTMATVKATVIQVC